MHPAHGQPHAASAYRRRDSRRLSVALVTLLALGSLLFGISSVPVTDRDEPRFAQASRQMAESSRLADWVVPRVGDEIRLKKPPLIYWAQAPTVLALTAGEPSRDAIWMYRLPSAIAAWLAALATLWIGRRMFGGNAGLLAACLLVVAPVIAVDCHMARADEVLLLATTLAMGCLWRLWRTHRLDPAARGGLPLSMVAPFWLCVGLGILAKYPITPFVAGSAAFCCAAARRDWRFLWRLRPFVGVSILAAIAVPWLLLAVREVGWETLRATLDREVVQRAREGAEGHAAPPGYYLVTILAFFFPGALILALGFERAVKRAFVVRGAAGGLFARLRARFASTRGRDAELFLIAWIVPTWIAFELVVTKFPHYILPVYPALALVVARCALGGLRALPKPLNAGDRFTFGAWAVVGSVLALAGAVLVAFFAATGRTVPATPSLPALADRGIVGIALASLATLAAVVLVWRALALARQARFVPALVVAIPATMLAEMALFAGWIPEARWIWNTPRIVGAIAADSGRVPADADFPPVAGVGYNEDSLLWSTRNRLVRFGDAVDDSNRAALHAWCTAHAGGYLLVPKAQAREFAPYGIEVSHLVGFNYSDGDPVDHALIRLSPRPAERPATASQ